MQVTNLLKTETKLNQLNKTDMNLNLLQDKKIKWLIAGLTVIGGVIGVLVYIDQKKHNKVQRDLFALDKEIKMLQLQKLKNGN